MAAKSLNMRSIWARELVMDKLKKPTPQVAESNRTVEELVKEVSEMQVVKMQLGAGDYLTSGLSARVCRRYC